MWWKQIDPREFQMTSTIHHPVAIPSRGLIICEMEEESNEPKTILEIGGVSRPRPTYILPPQRAHTLSTSINTQPYMSHWKAQHDIVPPPYPAFTAFQEQRVIRLSNENWSGPLPDKIPITSPSFTPKGFIFWNSSFRYRKKNKHTWKLFTFTIMLNYTDDVFHI